MAHPIRVEEITDNDRHEVMLHAGTKVLGITRPQVNEFASGPAPTEFVLELQDPVGTADGASGVDQVFALDGDSIILASSRPCINTEEGGKLVAGGIKLPGDPTPLCPAPPPQLVIQAGGAYGSPLFVGPRNLDDSEFWDFEPIDPFPFLRRPRYPTSGFVRVDTNYDLWNSICKNPVAAVHNTPDGPVADPLTQPCIEFKADAWGKVIVVTSPKNCDRVAGPAPGQTQNIGGCIDLSLYPPVLLPAGVTVRGDRRGINLGPQLYFSVQDDSREIGLNPCHSPTQYMLEVHGDYVRVTGLRLRGQNRSTDENAKTTSAVGVGFPGLVTGPLFSITTSTQHIAAIDHNDISDWGSAAVSVIGPYCWETAYEFVYIEYQICSVMVNGQPFKQRCGCNVQVPGSQVSEPITNDPSTLANVRIARNFLHHNERESGGYGVGVGRALIEGNTFVSNRHAITADGEPHTAYRIPRRVQPRVVKRARVRFFGSSLFQSRFRHAWNKQPPSLVRGTWRILCGYPWEHLSRHEPRELRVAGRPLP
jgi:hypothetical protein